MADDTIDQISSVWTSADYSGTAHRLRPAATEVLRELDGHPPGHVVDVGAGHGHLAAELVEHGWQVTAVEPTAALRRTGSATAPGATWVAGVAEHLPVDDGSADAVVSTFALIFAQPDAAVAEVVRVLKPGGRLVMTAWADDGYMHEMTRRMARVLPAVLESPSMPWGDPASVRARLSAHGLTPVVRRARLPWHFDGVDEALEFYRTSSPAHAAVLSCAGDRAPDLLHELGAHLDELRAANGELRIDADYLVVTAHA